MRTEEAVNIIGKLALGIDPATGQELSGETVLNRPEVIRALVFASELLRSKAKDGPANKPLRAGESWTSLEDQELASMFRERMSVAQLANHFGRSRGAITARLVKIGLVSDRQSVRDLSRQATQNQREM